MEEIKRLEKELSEANERTMRCTLKMHNEVQAEKAKVLALEKQMAMIAKKVRDSGTMETELPPDEQYVSGGEEELVFTRPTPSTHIRSLMEIENKVKAKRDSAAREDRDAAYRRIAKKTSPHWDSDTGLSRDMNPIWENTEYSANSERQITVGRQSELTKAKHTPTQRQVYTIDGEETPATPGKTRGTTVDREATPHQAGVQQLITDGTATVRDPTISSTRATEETQTTAASAATLSTGIGIATAPTTTLNATWTANGPTMGMTKLITLPKMVDSPKILTWSRLEIKQFTEWCQANQVNNMSTPEQWSLIAQCFPQETMDVMETIVGGRRNEEDLPRQELKKLTLDEAMRCLKASAPDVGSNYNKAITLAGNLLRQTKTRIPLSREAALEMDKQIRAIMNVCPEETAKNIDSVRSEFRAWASSMRAPSEMDEGGALSLKTQFVTFMKNGKHGRQIEDYREVGERLLQWAKTRTDGRNRERSKWPRPSGATVVLNGDSD